MSFSVWLKFNKCTFTRSDTWDGNVLSRQQLIRVSQAVTFDRFHLAHLGNRLFTPKYCQRERYGYVTNGSSLLLWNRRVKPTKDLGNQTCVFVKKKNHFAILLPYILTLNKINDMDLRNKKIVILTFQKLTFLFWLQALEPRVSCVQPAVIF